MAATPLERCAGRAEGDEIGGGPDLSAADVKAGGVMPRSSLMAVGKKDYGEDHRGRVTPGAPVAVDSVDEQKVMEVKEQKVQMPPPRIKKQRCRMRCPHGRPCGRTAPRCRGATSC
jgi:hypothetical protein